MFKFIKWHPFSFEEEQKILEAIAAAEKTTSGEIRVHVDKYCKTDPLIKGKNCFVKLHMQNTRLRNGVLIYMSIKDCRFAIVGDIGIDEKVGEGFWQSTKDIMQSHFQKSQLVDGICAGIAEVGKQLKDHFPYEDGDIDELPNTISYG